MDLHLDQVPAREVWATRIENSFGGDDIEWFITAEASSDDYRSVVGWWEYPNKLFEDQEVVITRWYIELPRQRMERDEVDAWVEYVLHDEEAGAAYSRRLDVKRLTAPARKAAKR